MATHSSILPWKIPWTGEPGGLWGHKEPDTIEHRAQNMSGYIAIKAKMRIHIAPEKISSWRRKKKRLNN